MLHPERVYHVMRTGGPNTNEVKNRSNEWDEGSVQSPKIKPNIKTSGSEQITESCQFNVTRWFYQKIVKSALQQRNSRVQKWMLEWSLIILLLHKTIMQKNGIVTPNQNEESLKQKAGLSIIAWLIRKLATEFGQESATMQTRNSRTIMLTNPKKIARKRFAVFSSTIGSKD